MESQSFRQPQEIHGKQDAVKYEDRHDVVEVSVREETRVGADRRAPHWDGLTLSESYDGQQTSEQADYVRAEHEC